MLDFVLTISGVFMPVYYGLEVNSDKLEAYATKDLDYKIQARNIVCDRLGYEPPIELSVLGELCIRTALKGYDNQEFSKEKLQEKIDFHVNTIKTVMLEYAQIGQA
ncbi:hypothetical protein [Flavisericum labens]|uniref:hypothetical protein n=1 Tax=Flavisericum labens TaxID=3377112 RepID=UPI00387B2B52